MSDLNLKNTSQLIEDQWLNLVSKYFPDDNINLMKAGLFGYINEIMAQEIKNSIYHKNFIYDEYLLNTASTSKSIYNFAKLYNVLVDNAHPSKVSAILTIKESDLEKTRITNRKALSSQGSTDYSIVSKDTLFTINSLPFRLPYDIKILFNYSPNDKNTYVISASYEVEDYEFPYLDVLNNNILKSWSDYYEGNKYIYIKVDLFQLEKSSSSTLILNESTLYNTYYKYNFSNQLAYFNLWYEKDGVKELVSVLSNNTYSLAGNKKYCYYNVTDSNVLEITFSSLFNSFRPEYGARIYIDIYTTKGAVGNLGTLDKLDYTYQTTNFGTSTPILIDLLSDCTGGSDKPSLLELKKKIIEKNLTRGAIVTEPDLNRFFNSINDSMNNSQIKFVKKRNDILRKIYGAYILLRDQNNVVIPTRTIDQLSISANQISEMKGSLEDEFTIPERSYIVYDIEAKNYILVNKEVEKKKYMDNTKYLVYNCPYSINVNTSNFMQAKYYLTYLSEDVSLNYEYINSDIPFTFLIHDFSVVRNSLENESYKFSLNLSTDFSTDNGSFDDIKIRAILKNSKGNVYGYFEFTRVDDNELYYEANLSSEKYDGIHDGKLSLYNSVFDISTEPIKEPNGQTSLPNVYVDEDTTIELQVLFKSSYSSYKYGEANSMPDLITSDDTKYATATAFTNDTTYSLFTNMSDYVTSTAVPSSDTGGVIIKSIPVIEHSYFNACTLEIYRMLYDYRELLEGNMNKLDMNTDLDMKFFNTHGPSSMMYVSKNTDNLTRTDEYVYLDRIDLDLKLTIHLEKTANQETKEEISKYLSDTLESLNSKGYIAMSNIVSKMEKKFSVISYIEWDSINDKNYQKIVNLEYDKPNLDTDYVPEFVNVRKGLNIVSTKDNDTVILANASYAKYSYSITINYK